VYMVVDAGVGAVVVSVVVVVVGAVVFVYAVVVLRVSIGRTPGCTLIVS
jgi:hypothetical protein